VTRQISPSQTLLHVVNGGPSMASMATVGDPSGLLAVRLNNLATFHGTPVPVSRNSRLRVFLVDRLRPRLICFNGLNFRRSRSLGNKGPPGFVQTFLTKCLFISAATAKQSPATVRSGRLRDSRWMVRHHCS